MDVRFKLLFYLMKLSIKNGNKINQIGPLCSSLFQRWIEEGTGGREQCLYIFNYLYCCVLQNSSKKEQSMETKSEREGSILFMQGDMRKSLFGGRGGVGNRPFRGSSTLFPFFRL